MSGRLVRANGWFAISWRLRPSVVRRRTVRHLLWNYEQLGRFGDAVETRSRLGSSPDLLASLKKSLAAPAQDGYWRLVLQERLKASRNENSNVGAYTNATLFSRLQDRDHAFAWLDRAFEDRSSLLVYLKVDPAFDNLRGDPRFAGMIRRVGLE